MKFKITSTTWWDTDKMLEHYPWLAAKFRFNIERIETPKYCTIKDENGNPMKFEYDVKVEYVPYVHIDTIDELILLTQASGEELIITGRGSEIEIYDGYRE